MAMIACTVVSNYPAAERHFAVMLKKDGLRAASEEAHWRYARYTNFREGRMDICSRSA